MVATDPASQIAALQQQVAVLQAAVQALQVKTQFVTSNGSDYTLNVPGNVRIRAGGPASNMQITANNGLQVMAGNTLDIRAATSASLWASGSATLRGDGGTRSWARPSRSIATAPRSDRWLDDQSGGDGHLLKVVTGSSTVLIGN